LTGCADKAQADPAALGVRGSGGPKTYRITQIVSGSFVLNSLLLREVNFLGNLLVIALITTAGPRDRD
jgi:hypothetical protein